MDSKIDDIIQMVMHSYKFCESIIHPFEINALPLRKSIINILDSFCEIIFPGYFCAGFNKNTIENNVRKIVSSINKELTEQVKLSLCYKQKLNLEQCSKCDECYKNASQVVLSLIEEIPRFRKLLSSDIEASYLGDPAASNLDEIILSYPGLQAIMVHRIAHSLYIKGIPLIPRIMSEYAHGKTGIDIHPGAEIGEQFFIDHGTGVVIGATTIIGNNVKIYQGVTLGALSFPKMENGELIRNVKRHPTIEDDVVIYSGATILGGNTVIGRGSIIGGNVWVTHSVAPGSKVVIKEPEVLITTRSS